MNRSPRPLHARPQDAPDMVVRVAYVLIWLGLVVLACVVTP